MKSANSHQENEMRFAPPLTKRQLEHKFRIQRSIQAICPHVGIPYDVGKLLLSYVTPLDQQMLFLAAGCAIDKKHKTLLRYFSEHFCWSVDCKKDPEDRTSTISGYDLSLRKDFFVELKQIGILLLRGGKLHSAEWKRFFEDIFYMSSDFLPKIVFLHQKCCPHLELSETLVEKAFASLGSSDSMLDYLLENRKDKRPSFLIMNYIITRKNPKYLDFLLRDSSIPISSELLELCVNFAWVSGYETIIAKRPHLRNILPNNYLIRCASPDEGDGYYMFLEILSWIHRHTSDVPDAYSIKSLTGRYVDDAVDFRGSQMFYLYLDFGGVMDAGTVFEDLLYEGIKGDLLLKYVEALEKHDLFITNRSRPDIFRHIVGHLVEERHGSFAERMWRFQMEIGLAQRLKIPETADALRLLAMHGQLEAMQFLLESGFPLNSSVRMFSLLHGHGHIVQWLDSLGENPYI